MKLTKAEEQLMEIIWKNEKIFFKDILDGYSEPKPAATTVATLLKRMQEKAVVAYQTLGNSRQYYPLIEKSLYFSNEMSGMIRNYFDNSALQFASFFTRSSKLTNDELEKLKKIIDQEIEKRGK